MKTNYLKFIGLFCAYLLVAAQDIPKIAIKHLPKNPIVENYQNRYLLNFDFSIDKSSLDTLYLDKIIGTFTDEKNNFLSEKFIDNNGSSPSINIATQKEFNAISSQTIFNPFHENVNNNIAKIIYQFVFLDNLDNETIVLDTVLLANYKQLYTARLPLIGKLLVYDGHDFLSHHRRLDLDASFVKKVGFKGNFMRYAYDFIMLDSLGRKFINTGKDKSEWYAFAKPVYAIANGEIVACRDTLADDKSFNMQTMSINPFELFGNYVVIKHSDGNFSVYGHLKQNSLNGLKNQTEVKQNQKIGEIGLSGSTFFPHLHFEVQNSIDFAAEGLPSYFTHFNKISGKNVEKIKFGTINSGDLIESIK